MATRNILGKPGKGAVKGLFYIIGEDAGRQLVKLQMIGDAFTALALSGARFIGAVALQLIGFNIAFHL
jgi:hypothetical protein